MSDKIQPQHVTRKAVLYVRQSSQHQVLHNQESQRLQYAMQQRLKLLGWNEIEVIDEDLGRSASGNDRRSGFERMVAEVCLGKVGAVAAREASRFARNSREWQQLVEVCRIVDTLLIDHETVYAPRQGNDRLLLGLKGSLNEYELDLLRHRSVEARREKARRGELIITAPVGFIKTDDQRLEMDPDRRVQDAIRLVFRKFQELGTARQTLLWFLGEGLQLPVRGRHGETTWKRPSYAAVRRFLTHPAYGGAYAYGKSEQVAQFDGAATKRRIRRKPREEWLALIPESHEGYITWEEFQRVGRLLAANNCQNIGAPKKGAALLAGLLRCRRCGRKLTVRYTGGGRDVLRYSCVRGWLDQGESRCLAFGGVPVDEAIAGQVLCVVAPAGVEAAVLARQQQQTQVDEVRLALERDLEAARYAARRAAKQFDGCDPDNRLVADELERRWNAALETVRGIEARLADQPPAAVPTASVEEFAELASDLDAVWNSPAADAAIKKRLVRTLIEEIVVDYDAETSEIVLFVHWKGGAHTELRTRRRRRGQMNHTSVEIVAAVRSLARLCSDDVIAATLNRNGLKTGRGNRWTRERVVSLRNYHRIECYNRERCQQEGWLKLNEAADVVGVSPMTLRLAVERGDIPGEHPLPDGPWVTNRRDLETEAAERLRQRARSRSRTPAKPDPLQKTLGFSGT
jgi:DNA invertase Pin-like site-specific DNA recombinase